MKPATGCCTIRKKVAIVGGGPTKSKAPLADQSWDIWTFGRAKQKLARFDRWFEMHSIPQLRALRGDRRTKMRYPEYWRFLGKLRCPVYMQKRHSDIPASVPYPLERAIKEFGRCFTSTVSYMIALAIMEGYSHIGLWGIDLTDRAEYLYERAAVEYLLGVAAARGIVVVLPASCTLTVPLHPKPVYTQVLYGYDWDHPEAWWNQREAKQSKESEEKENEKKPGARSKKAKSGRAKRAKAGFAKAKRHAVHRKVRKRGKRQANRRAKGKA